MDQIELVAEARSVTGKKVKTLRRQGLVPLVVYGKADPTNIQALEFDARRAIGRAGGQLISLRIQGESSSRMVLAREMQYDVLSSALLHADMYEVDMTSKIQISVRLSFVGTSQLVETGQAMQLQVLNEIEIECLPSDIVQSIDVDVSQLQELSDAIHVRDLSFPGDIELLTPAEELVVRLEAIYEEEEEEEEEGLEEVVEAGEVEVIQRGRVEEEEEEE